MSFQTLSARQILQVPLVIVGILGNFDQRQTDFYVQGPSNFVFLTEFGHYGSRWLHPWAVKKMKNCMEISSGMLFNIWMKELTINTECRLEQFYFSLQHLANASVQVQMSSTTPQFVSSKIFVAIIIVIQHAFIGRSETFLANGG